MMSFQLSALPIVIILAISATAQAQTDNQADRAPGKISIANNPPRTFRLSEPFVSLRSITRIHGQRSNTLTGIGVVTGLAGTGDGTATARRSLANMLRRMGRNVSPSELASGNIAMVQISAKLPAFARQGTPLDVLVASIGEASSLRGGNLIETPLYGADGKIYALASGSLITGFKESGRNAEFKENHPTVGRIANGAICEPPVEDLLTSLLNDSGELRLLLTEISTGTAVRARSAIDGFLGAHQIGSCKLAGPNLLSVRFNKHQSTDQLLEILDQIGTLQIQPVSIPTITCNQRNGTVVIGAGVRISPCLIGIENLTVQVTENVRISQPGNAFSKNAPGETQKYSETEIKTQSEGSGLQPLESQENLGHLLQALRLLGVDGRQLITVIKELHGAGKIHGELIIR